LGAHEQQTGYVHACKSGVFYYCDLFSRQNAVVCGELIVFRDARPLCQQTQQI
jgi:hypothetical protein